MNRQTTISEMKRHFTALQAWKEERARHTAPTSEYEQSFLTHELDPMLMSVYPEYVQWAIANRHALYHAEKMLECVRRLTWGAA